MGCGTGELQTAGNQYNVVLTFNPPINDDDPIYTNFQSALDWLLLGLRALVPPASGTSAVNKNNTFVTSITVTVNGPLKKPNVEKFNRAFNRLLWGARHKRSQNHRYP